MEDGGRRGVVGVKYIVTKGEEHGYVNRGRAAYAPS